MGTTGIEATTIDPTFDVQRDAGGRDPDRYSPTLRRYHQLLWSKPLPNGDPFDLAVRRGGPYLEHASDRGAFVLSSDSVIQTFIRWPKLDPITRQLSEADRDSFFTHGYTVGGMLIFPANQIDRQWSINQARGCTRRIADRIDLTLECIRRHYVGQPSPMTAVLDRYRTFFDLFESFEGYTTFFLLDDLVDDGAVQFLLPFDDFASPSRPQSVGDYRSYRERSMALVTARGARMVTSLAG